MLLLCEISSPSSFLSFCQGIQDIREQEGFTRHSAPPEKARIEAPWRGWAVLRPRQSVGSRTEPGCLPSKVQGQQGSSRSDCPPHWCLCRV